MRATERALRAYCLAIAYPTVGYALSAYRMTIGSTKRSLMRTGIAATNLASVGHTAVAAAERLIGMCPCVVRTRHTAVQFVIAVTRMMSVAERASVVMVMHDRRRWRQ